MPTSPRPPGVSSTQSLLPSFDNCESVLLIDSDIFALLAGEGVLEPAVKALGFASSCCARLDALPWMVRDRRAFPDLSQDQVDRIILWCGRIPSWADPGPLSLGKRLAKYRRIDPGEVLLLTALVEHPNFFLLSGDKNWMRVLGSSPELQDIREAISGRVICLERLLEVLIKKLGMRGAAKLLSPARKQNKTLAVLLSEGERTSEAHCREGLRSYLDDLEQLLGADFFLAVPN
jgi:hypothetical protein